MRNFRIYDYGTGSIKCVLPNGKQCSYSKKRYGPLLNDVIILTEKENRKIWNYYEIENDIIKLFYYHELTDTTVFTIIDKQDYDKVKNVYWSCSFTDNDQYTRWWTRGLSKSGHTLLSRYLLNAPNNLTVDHIDRDPNNNRRSNLRLATISLQNTNRRINNKDYVGIRFREDCGQKYEIRTGYQGQVLTDYSPNFEEALMIRKNHEKIISQLDELEVQRLSSQAEKQ